MKTKKVVKILDKATAFAKGKKVKCTITVLDAKNQSVENYKKRYGKKAVYIKNGKEYVKPFIRTRAQSQMDILRG